MAHDTIKPNKPWMKYLLIVSLGLNLAVAGLFIGAKVSGHHKSGGGGPVSTSNMRVFMHALPDSKRKEVRKYFRKNRAELRAKGEAFHENMKTISTAILKQPFDEATLNQAFGEQSTYITTITQDAQKAFVAIIASMTDEERATYVATIQKQRRNWRKDKKRK